MTEDVEVVSEEITSQVVEESIYVSSGEDYVEVVVVLAGEQGPPGVNGAGYTHTQSTPSTSWVVNHNLGFEPTVTVFSVGGMQVLASVLHTSLNQSIISFASPYSGRARCI